MLHARKIQAGIEIKLIQKRISSNIYLYSYQYIQLLHLNSQDQQLILKAKINASPQLYIISICINVDRIYNTVIKL